MFRKTSWLPVALTTAAAVMFVLVVIAFAREVFAFRDAVESWARRDLRSQAELAAENLLEPLRTQDFRRIREFSDALKAKDLELAITTVRGGTIFVAHGAEGLFGREAGTPVIGESVTRGEYVIAVMTPLDRVLEPYFRSLNGLGLAILVGALGVFLFFFVTYRQHVRIRELAKLEKFRSEFIADVSHEIKTPLSGILGAVDLLREEGMGKREKGKGMVERLIEMIEKESKRLNGLVQSILDLARLEREGEMLNLTETDLSALVKDVVEGLVPSARAAGISLVLAPSLRPLCGENPKVDASLVMQAVSNLIGNAIRHSGSKDIVVSLESVGREIRIAVEDHGIGIPPEHAAQVFERFHRVDPARAAETGGAGLGLAIARRIARLHGGDLVLFPAKPHGCRFVFSLTIR